MRSQNSTVYKSRGFVSNNLLSELFCRDPSELKVLHRVRGKNLGADGYQPQEKNPIVAGGLSFILAGIGQIYNGQTVKGVILVLTSLICIWISGLLYLVLWIFGMYDAYTTAQKINEGKIIT